jgi:hypothetical protein
MGFCRRESKLNPSVFFELLFYCASRTENNSLSFMVSYLESNYPGCGGDIHSRSKAGISIQYEYDLKSGEIREWYPPKRNECFYRMTEGTKTRSRFSLFITNAGREALASDAFYILEITLSC